MSTRSIEWRLVTREGTKGYPLIPTSQLGPRSPQRLMDLSVPANTIQLCEASEAETFEEPPHWALCRLEALREHYILTSPHA